MSACCLWAVEAASRGVRRAPGRPASQLWLLGYSVGSGDLESADATCHTKLWVTSFCLLGLWPGSRLSYRRGEANLRPSQPLLCPTLHTPSSSQRRWPFLVSSKQAMTCIPGPIGRSWPLILCLCPSVCLSVSLLLLLTGQWKAVGGRGLRPRHTPPPGFYHFLLPVWSLSSAQASALQRAQQCSCSRAVSVSVCPGLAVPCTCTPSPRLLCL